VRSRGCDRSVISADVPTHRAGSLGEGCIASAVTAVVIPRRGLRLFGPLPRSAAIRRASPRDPRIGGLHFRDGPVPLTRHNLEETS
jgi:hypothetical protein